MTVRPSARSLVSGLLLLLAAIAWLAPSGLAQELELPGTMQSAPEEAPAKGATEREVEAELDVGQDRPIAERLRATFAGVEALRGVRVSVNAGVVRLTGEVPSAAGRELAGQLARQIEAVALVENEIQVAQDVGRRPRRPGTTCASASMALPSRTDRSALERGRAAPAPRRSAAGPARARPARGRGLLPPSSGRRQRAAGEALGAACGDQPGPFVARPEEAERGA
jgi:BON domain